MSGLNLTTFSQYCKDPCFVRLTPTMISFARACITHTQAAMKLYSQELYHPIVDSITELLRTVTHSISKSMAEVRDQEKGTDFLCYFLIIRRSKTSPSIREIPGLWPHSRRQQDYKGKNWERSALNSGATSKFPSEFSFLITVQQSIPKFLFLLFFHLSFTTLHKTSAYFSKTTYSHYHPPFDLPK